MWGSRQGHKMILSGWIEREGVGNYVCYIFNIILRWHRPKFSFPCFTLIFTLISSYRPPLSPNRHSYRLTTFVYTLIVILIVRNNLGPPSSPSGSFFCKSKDIIPSCPRSQCTRGTTNPIQTCAIMCEKRKSFDRYPCQRLCSVCRIQKKEQLVLKMNWHSVIAIWWWLDKS